MTNKYPKVFYTSDLHIGHKFVAGTRGFLKEEHKGKEIDFNNKDKLPAGVREWTDPDAHNNWLANIWDNTVREIDIIYLLGDMSMFGGDACLKWLDERPGKKNLILGNHEPNHPSNHDSEKHAAVWNPHFNDIQAFSRRRLGGQEVLMSHFPYSGRGAEGHGVRERHTQYRLKDMGLPLLHGHTHGKEKIHFSDFGTPQIHVGIDSWGRFVEQDEIIEMLNEIYPPVRIRPYTPSPTYTYMRQGNKMKWNELTKMYDPVKEVPKPVLASA